MKKTIRYMFAALMLAGAFAGHAQDKARRTDVLFWSQAEREAHFRDMPAIFAGNTVAHGDRVHVLPQGRPLRPRWPDGQSLQAYMSAHKVAAVMVLQHGRVRIERYGLGFNAAGRWTSFSVAKSFTSTLVGAALADGSIRSLDDPVVRYIPALKGSAYEGVNIRQLLSMTSGVRWNEDYSDPKSDVARMYSAPRVPGEPALVTYMKTLGREAPPGSKWVYKTGETDLIGILVTQATGKTLAQYLGEKIWRPYGMASDAAWLKDEADGTETGGCCISATAADYARMGQFILDGGRINGKSVLAPGYLADATRKHASTDTPGIGYGYQWWTYDDGRFTGIGIFGQMMHIDPKRGLVIVQLAAWPSAVGPDEIAARRAFVAAVTAGVDAETTHTK